MKPRWKVSTTYRTNHGLRTFTGYVQEIAKVDAIIEDGPHWDTLVQCVITRTLKSTLTIEEAKKL